ncbi:hypothetical protein V6N12_063241 [Hibiscus sabdariffa]|uniref:Protein EARLY FLOWERING 4 domain-containing protein n=1 Tax=Hibiscus sabdariffa TaxID=183260 RepID=A0ABR2FB56_9ROSI
MAPSSLSMTVGLVWIGTQLAAQHTSNKSEAKKQRNQNRERKKKQKQKHQDSEGANGDNKPEIWATFDESFKQVQWVLDRNRALIKQVNHNHQSRIPTTCSKTLHSSKNSTGTSPRLIDSIREG